MLTTIRKKSWKSWRNLIRYPLMTYWMITIASYYKGQGKMIREYRESLGLKKKQFARLIKLDPGTLRCSNFKEFVYLFSLWMRI